MRSTAVFLLGAITVVLAVCQVTAAATVARELSPSSRVQQVLSSERQAEPEPVPAPEQKQQQQQQQPVPAHKVKREAVQHCGRRLVEVVQSICKGQLYSGLPRRRRSASDQTESSLSFNMWDITSNRRVRRSITDECCKKPCMEEDITKYCHEGRRWNTIP